MISSISLKRRDKSVTVSTKTFDGLSKAEQEGCGNYMYYWPVRAHHLLFVCRDSADAKVVDVASREGEASETTDASVSNLFETELKLKKSRF